MINVRACLILAALPSLILAQTSVTLTATPNPSKFGAAVVVTAAVTPLSATGRVTFYDGVTVLGTKPLASGAASLSTILLPAGNHKLKAYYAGSASNAAATSNVVSQTVNAVSGGGLAVANPAGIPGFVLAQADFNGDGKADLAIANPGPSGGLSIQLGDGAGNFQVSFTESATTVLWAVVGDFNGDGIPDLANLSFSTPGNATMNILLGKGDGTFQPPASFPMALGVVALTVGDFNGDGKADLAATDLTAGVDILLGNGDGTFQPAVSYAAGPPPILGAIFVLAADFNGDGKADLATVSGTGLVDILLGKGDGTFQSPAMVALPSGGFLVNTLAAGDFNGDGKADLVTNRTDVLLGNGDGTFQNSTNYGGGLITPAFALGDFNGDGKTDLALAANGTLYLLSGVGDGTFLSPVIATVLPQNPFAQGLLVGDFNGDGKTDLAVGSISTYIVLGTTVTVTPTAGTPQSTGITKPFPLPLQVVVKNGPTPMSGVTVTFTPPPPAINSSSPSATFSSNTAITDANGMASVTATANPVVGSYNVTATALGVSTLFALTNTVPMASTLTASPGSTPQSALVGSVFPKPLAVKATDASGAPVSGVAIGFTAPVSGASAVLPLGAVFTDANGVASVTASANHIPGAYTVTASSGTVSATFSLTNVSPTPAAVTLTTSSNPSNFGSAVTLTATVSSSPGNGRVTFFDGVTPLGTKTASSGAASFNTILLSAGTHKLTAYYRDEAGFVAGTSNAVTQTVKAAAGGAFITQSPIGAAPTGSSVVVGDFNHDGKVDVAFPRFIAGFADAVTVLLGKGDGNFQPPVDYAVAPGGNATFIVSSDFDGDGNADLAVGSASTRGVTVLMGNSDGTFRIVANNNLGAMNVLAAGDFNGDGKPDIIIPNTGTTFLPQAQDVGLRPHEGSPINFTNLSLLAGNGDGTFGAATVYASLFSSFSPAPGVTHLLVADFNGDGKPDVAVSFDSAAPVIVFGNGDGTGQIPVSLNLGGFNAVASLLAGDFNGDGKTDLVASGSGATVILLGKGDGTFQPPATYQFGAAVLSGDFNGDGFTDLVVVDSSQRLSGIQLGRGDGTFQQGPAASSGFPLAVTDFNGDGKADILAASINGLTTSVLLGATSSGSGQPASITATGGTPQSTLVNTLFPQPLEVTVRDSAGNPVQGVFVTFTLPTTGPGLFPLPVPAPITDASGKASFPVHANNIAGSFTVTASVGSLTASFFLTNLPDNNLAHGKLATQSSTLPSYATAGPGSAVDSNTDGNFFDGSVTHTNLENNPWWQVDLGAATTISSVVIWNRTDCCGARLGDFWVFISNTPFLSTDTPATLQNRAGTFSSHQTAAPNPSATVAVNGVQGRYLRVQLSGTDYLSLAEVQVFGAGGGPPTADLAQGKSAAQSSTLPGTPPAGVAVDGNTDGNFFDGSVTATNVDPNAWWQVDLGGSATVSSVVIFNRTDCCGARLSDYWVFISNTPFLPTDTPATLQNRAGTFGSHQTTAPNPSTTIATNGAQGRYVRVQLSGTDYLSLAEVQVFGAGGTSTPNVSQGKPATQSSTLPETPPAGVAVDGNTDGNFFDGSVTATNLENNPWWQVDLGASTTLNSIVVWNRTDCCGSRLNDYWVFISDTPFLAADTPATLQSRAGTFGFHQTSAPNPSTLIFGPCSGTACTAIVPPQGRYVRIQLTNPNYLSLAEVQVFGTAGSPPPTKVASQSSTLAGTPPPNVALDGNTDGNFFDGSVTATNLETNPWWQVDLGASTAISTVTIWNRTDCCGTRLSDYWVFVSDTPFLAGDTPATLQNRAGTINYHGTTPPAPNTAINFSGAEGRYVRVQLSGTNYLSLAEVQVFGQ